MAKQKMYSKDFQLNPITDKVMHFDLVGISDNEIIDIEVPIVLIGTPKGIKDGGTLQHTLHKLKKFRACQNLFQNISK